MFKLKFIALMLSFVFAASFSGCSLVVEDHSSGSTPTPVIETVDENDALCFESSSSPTGFTFKYNATEYIYRLTSYIGSDNKNNEQAFNDLKIDTNEFITQTLENGLISTSGIHEINNSPAFSFVFNADKDGKVFDIALIMYPDFMKQTAQNGNVLYPYLVSYALCAAIECEAVKASSIIVELMSDDEGAQSGKYSFESEDIYYHFLSSDDSSTFTISAGGEGIFNQIDNQ